MAASGVSGLTSKQKIEKITQEGDLHIKLSPGHAVTRSFQFLVDSHVLYIASPVFKAMFGPGSSFRERKELESGIGGATALPVIELHDDDAEALRTVFNILHNKHSRVPRSVTYHQFLEIAILADKYELREPIQIWAEIWSEPYLMAEDMMKPEDSEWLFIL